MGAGHDLEKALAADKEWSRSIRREPLTPEDLVESPTELRALQDAYVDRQDRVEQQVAADFVRDLEREAKELAQAGNLTDGRVLQQEIDKIKRLYLTNANAPATETKGTQRGKAAPGEPEDPILACEEAIRQKRLAIQAQYVGELESLEKSFQAKGALEDVFAAKAERVRFMEAPVIDKKNLVDTPDALRDLQRQYLELQQNVSTSVAEEFAMRLEQQKQSLTIEGKLDEAMAAKKAAERIRQQFDRDRKEESPLRKKLIGKWDAREHVFFFHESGDVEQRRKVDGSLAGVGRLMTKPDGNLGVAWAPQGSWWDFITIASDEVVVSGRLLDGRPSGSQRLKRIK